jgi:2-oxoglutarate dehydrogenase E2 component (dihydrolipoamide succinyltransferase)
VRRLAEDGGVDVATVTGTGRDGRVTRADVIAHVGPAPTGTSAAAHDEVVALNPVQRRAGTHLLQSSQTAAHAFVAMEVEFDNVDAARRRRRLTFLPFIARAVVAGARRYPWVNATVTDGEARAHPRIHLGIAVDMEHRGLIVPVVRDAHDKDLLTLANDIADMARRARTRTLAPDDVAGGTFTITNPGPAGTAISVPIINQPQVAILSTDGVTRRAVVVEGADGRDAIGTRSIGVLGLSWDHRVFDTAYAASFLAHVREVLESHDWEAEAR